MSRARWMVVCFALAALVRGAPAVADEGEGAPSSRRTLAECLEAAHAYSQRLKVAAAVIDEAEADRKVARGRFGPVVRLEASAGRFDAPYSIAIPLSIPGVEVPPIQVRGRDTAQVTASLVQPIGSLWTIAEAHRAQALGEQAAKAEQVATRNDVVLEVVEAYVQALEAERMQGIAEGAVHQIEAHLEQARQLQLQEVVARREVLKAEVGLSEAQLALAQARAGERRGRARDRDGAPARGSGRGGRGRRGGPDCRAALRDPVGHRDGGARCRDIACPRPRPGVERAPGAVPSATPSGSSRRAGAWWSRSTLNPELIEDGGDDVEVRDA